MRYTPLLLALAALSGLHPSDSFGARYAVDTDHSSIVLNVTHLGIGTVQGRFDKFSGTFDYHPTNLTLSKVSVVIDASSINTNQALRDRHLRSTEFLDTEKYPEIRFWTTEVTRLERDVLKLDGNLSLHGVTRPVVLVATLTGMSPDMEGKNRIAFTATAQINRKDYGIDWNQMVGSNAFVGQVVQISLNVEGVEQSGETQ